MIKKLVTLAALAMLLGSPTSYATFVLGNTLVETCDSDNSYDQGICAGFVLGVSDRIERKFACPPKNGTVSGGQLVKVVRKYLEENPENLHWTGHFLVTIALSQAFPCPDD